jgi:hypothetical protein
MKPPSPGNGLTWREFDVFDASEVDALRRDHESRCLEQWTTEIVPWLTQEGATEAGVEYARKKFFALAASHFEREIGKARASLTQ